MSIEKIREHLEAVDTLLDGLSITPPNDPKQVNYSETPNKTRQMWADVSAFNIDIVDKPNNSILEKNCVNGTFFGRSDKPGVLYPTSILVIDGKIYRNESNHRPYPQSTFIVYDDNTVEMRLLHSASQLDISKVRYAIGGVGLVNKFNPDFEYAPHKEGFRGVYSDVLRRANKTVIGYRKKDNCIYLMTRPMIFHESAYYYDLRQLVDDCWYDIALSIDGGGSTMMKYDGKYKMYGDGRLINSIVGFNL